MALKNLTAHLEYNNQHGVLLLIFVASALIEMINSGSARIRNTNNINEFSIREAGRKESGFLEFKLMDLTNS